MFVTELASFISETILRCCHCKIIFIFVPLSANVGNIHIGESVFALSLTRNLAVSTNARTTAAPSLVLACVFSTNDTGCGDCFSLFAFGFCQNLLLDRRKKLHTFLLLFLVLELDGTKLTKMSRVIIHR